MENKLFIAPIFKSLSWHRKVGYKKIIQNKRFRFGIKIKNIGNKPFEGGLVKNILFYQAGIPKESTTAVVSDKEIKIPSLNPGEKQIIWIEKIHISFSGGTWLEFNIKGPKIILVYQWDKGNKEIVEAWKDKILYLFYIENKNILLQKITNILLILLTFVLVVSELLYWFFR